MIFLSYWLCIMFSLLNCVAHPQKRQLFGVLDYYIS